MLDPPAPRFSHFTQLELGEVGNEIGLPHMPPGSLGDELALPREESLPALPSRKGEGIPEDELLVVEEIEDHGQIVGGG